MWECQKRITCQKTLEPSLLFNQFSAISVYWVFTNCSPAFVAEVLLSTLVRFSSSGKLEENFETIWSFFKNTLKYWSDIGQFMENDPEDFWLNLGECQNRVSILQTEQSSHQFWNFISISDWLEPNFIALIITLHWDASKGSSSLQWTLRDKLTKVFECQFLRISKNG